MPVSRQNVGQGYPENGGRHEQQRAQEQGISKSFKIVGVLEEFQIIVNAPAVGSGDFKAFHYHNRQRIKHEKGNNQPQECCQIVIATRHVTSFRVCCVMVVKAMACPVKVPVGMPERYLTGQARIACSARFGSISANSLTGSPAQRDDYGYH